MSLWRQLTHGLRVLANRTAADRDVADEVEHYVAEATADWEASGLSPSRLDAVMYLSVMALLACAALMACGLPAWRAARVNPASTLRAG